MNEMKKTLLQYAKEQKKKDKLLAHKKKPQKENKNFSKEDFQAIREQMY